MGELNSAQKMPHECNKDPSRLRQLSPGMQVNTRYINATRGTSSNTTLLFRAFHNGLSYCTVLSLFTSASTCSAYSDGRKRCCTVLYCTGPPYLCQQSWCIKWPQEGVVLYSSVLSHLTSASTCTACSDCRKNCCTVLY